MIKRTIVVTAALVLAALFFFGHDAWSYVSTGAGMMKDTVKHSVPITFELDRARRMVKELLPDIRKNMHLIAQEEVEVERLDGQIAKTEAALTKDRSELMALKADATSGKSIFQYAGRSYSVEQVKSDLTNRFERYKTTDATLASLRDMHAARSRSLEAARQKLEAMLAAKRQLEVDVENLEARLKMVEVAQATSDVQFDDSQLSRVKELLTDLRTRLAVSERLVTAETRFNDHIPLEAPTDANIVDQITQYFAAPDAGPVKVAEVVPPVTQ